MNYIKQYDKDNINKIIERSHMRSEEYGIEKERVSPRKMLKGEQISNNIRNNRGLLKIAAPFIKKIYEIVAGSGFLLILTDRDGCILNIIGDKDMLRAAKDVDMIIGAYMDEKSIGTNAMGTAISEDVAIQISAKEHFINAYHRWTCSAAPIHDEEGEIIGTLNLTGKSSEVHSHTLGLVVASVNSIENELNNRIINNKLVEAYNYMNAIMDAMTYGVIAVNNHGIIQNLNKFACRIFNVREKECQDKPVSTILDNWEDILKKCHAKEVYKENDVIIRVGEKKERYSEDIHPIENENGELIGVVITIKEIQKVFNLVNKYSGMNARYTFDDLICEDKEIKRIIQFAKTVSLSPSTVLIQGESGTGKEVLAQSIHNYSTRREGPFVAINCGAIPKNLIESELFGYEEGSFTGGKKGGRPGKFELANGGTLFLDEIGEMPLDMQVNLLRVLQERCVTRVGGSRYIPIDVRIIVATNKELKKEIEKGTFRSDLYYRISVIPIEIPPLRERRADLDILLKHFLKIKSFKLKREIPNINENLYRDIMSYSWPGNVRELENFVENIVNLGGNTSFNIKQEPTIKQSKNDFVFDNLDYACSLEELERRAIIACLEKFKGNVSKSAHTLGISRNTLYTKMKKYKIIS
ncbi:sigma-54-dependent Fis family transcriptional regulator [Clostridium sp. KNHs214]|uniref:sigma-54-dependent Fis family transcriptional regulator n=1 Tax=Clostridium sp. KNHs214 TaxID=1540257 RepID=UPI0005552201|nr:sigma-54-dependent Fis family transcriptional regulator [Clostridium sp. KNHs214]